MSTCEVPGCDRTDVEPMMQLLDARLSVVAMCSDHAAEFTTPVEPAPPRTD